MGEGREGTTKVWFTPACLKSGKIRWRCDCPIRRMHTPNTEYAGAVIIGK